MRAWGADEFGRRLLTERVPDTADARVAVFYSISSTQRGLSGIDLGNFLIKQARRSLSLTDYTICI
jgi:hypothetical protein